jgi:hypothetical protein
MAPVDREDIAALLAQGDLGEFLKVQESAGALESPPEAVQEAPRRPGAWPAGTRPPGPPPPIPEHVVQTAVEEYRAWLRGERPHDPIRCDCQPCQAIAQRGQ